MLNPSACFGQSAVARFRRDVLDQPGVRAVIVLEGINDIGFSEDANLGCEAPNTNVSAAQIIDGYKKMIAAAHSHGAKIFGATMTPFGVMGAVARPLPPPFFAGATGLQPDSQPGCYRRSQLIQRHRHLHARYRHLQVKGNRSRAAPAWPTRPVPSAVTFRAWSQPLCRMAKSAPASGITRCGTP